MQLLGGRGAGASLTSLTLEYCGKQQRRSQEAYMIFSIVDSSNIVAVYLAIEL